MAPKTPQQQALEARQRLLRAERKAERKMRRLYAAAVRRIMRGLDIVLARIKQAEAAGLPISANWLYRETRLLSLLIQVEQQVSAFGAKAAKQTAAQQKAAIKSGRTLAEDQLRLTIGSSFNRLPKEALKHLAGRMADGTSLTEKLESFGPKAARLAEAALFAGVAEGEGPRQIARDVQRALATTYADALRVSRTEVLYAHRAASLETYKANSDVVRAYMWVAAKDGRTCAMCLALDGQEFTLDEPFDTHPNCRCTSAPLVTGKESEYQTGSEWLAGQDAATQREVLGIAAQKLYAKGDIELSDFVKNSAGGRSEKSLREIVTEKSLKISA